MSPPSTKMSGLVRNYHLSTERKSFFFKSVIRRVHTPPAHTYLLTLFEKVSKLDISIAVQLCTATLECRTYDGNCLYHTTTKYDRPWLLNALQLYGLANVQNANIHKFTIFHKWYIWVVAGRGLASTLPNCIRKYALHCCANLSPKLNRQSRQVNAAEGQIITFYLTIF